MRLISTARKSYFCQNRCAVIASIRLPTHTTCSVGVMDNILSRGCDGFDRSTGRLHVRSRRFFASRRGPRYRIRRVVMTVEAYGRGLWCSEPLRHDHPSSLCRPLPTWSHLWVLPVPPTGKILITYYRKIINENVGTTLRDRLTHSGSGLDVPRDSSTCLDIITYDELTWYDTSRVLPVPYGTPDSVHQAPVNAANASVASAQQRRYAQRNTVPCGA